MVRTTLTLDDDVARLVREAVQRDRRSMKDVVNDALRRALKQTGQQPRYRMDVHHSALQPGLDLGRLNQLADDLDEAATGRSSAAL